MGSSLTCCSPASGMVYPRPSYSCWIKKRAVTWASDCLMWTVLCKQLRGSENYLHAVFSLFVFFLWTLVYNHGLYKRRRMFSFLFLNCVNVSRLKRMWSYTCYFRSVSGVMFWQELVMDHILSSLHNTKGNRVPLLLLRQDQFIMHKKKSCAEQQRLNVT